MASPLLLAGIAALLVPAALPGIVPPLCADPCDVQASDVGYSPPVVRVESGGAVRWSTVDHTHIQVDSGVGERCLVAVASPFSGPGTAWFHVLGERLFVENDDRAPTQCVNHVRLEDGSFALPYHCALHPTMRGMVLVG